MNQLLAALPVILRDLAGLLGAASVAYGARLIYAPAGYIVGGLLLIAGSLFIARGAE